MNIRKGMKVFPQLELTLTQFDQKKYFLESPAVARVRKFCRTQIPFTHYCFAMA